LNALKFGIAAMHSAAIDLDLPRRRRRHGGEVVVPAFRARDTTMRRLEYLRSAGPMGGPGEANFILRGGA
jgi:hypothetical protein